MLPTKVHALLPLYQQDSSCDLYDDNIADGKSSDWDQPGPGAGAPAPRNTPELSQEETPPLTVRGDQDRLSNEPRSPDTGE